MHLTHAARLRAAAFITSLFAFAMSCAAAPAGKDTPPTLRAVAEDGRRVLLSSDGSWRFDPQQVGSASSTRADLPGSPYRTSVKRFTVAYDTSQWVQLPPKEGEENKRNFKHRNLPMQALVIADEFPANNASLHNVILHNARSVGATVTVLIDEERTLQAKQIGHLRFLASAQGMDFIFATHYFGDNDGNVQVSCFTAQSLFAKVQAECQRFLDGLTVQ